MTLEIKIGIILNYKNAEKKKDELFCVNSGKEYLKLANDPRFNEYCILKKKKRYVPADVAIGLYIEYYFNESDQFKFTIDYIKPGEISKKRFKQNDINLIIIYDLLESFHLSDKSNFYKFKNVLSSCDNVYPPYDYQKFINNKCTYYKYLASKKIPVAPTHCITKNKWHNRDSESYTGKIIKKIKSNEWSSFIAKPVYGQESKDFAKFMSPCESGECNMELQKNKLKTYLSKNIPKYKSIILSGL